MLPDFRNPPFPQAAAVLLAIALSGVVALAASDGGLLHPAAAPSDGWIRGIRVGGAIAVVAGLVALGLQARSANEPLGHRGVDPLAAGVGGATTLMILLTIIALFAPPRIVEGTGEGGVSLPREGTAVAEGATGTPPPPTTPGSAPVTEGYSMEEPLAPEAPPPTTPSRQDDPAAPAATPEGFDWDLLRRVAEPLLLIVLVGMAAAGILSLLSRRGPATPTSVDPPLSAEEASAGLSASKGEVLDGTGGPRRQITAAYERLLDALADAGAPRRLHEAPHEHLERALGPLGVTSAPMHRLARLYVAAQFSGHPMTDAHRTAAVEALDACLASLGPVPVPVRRPA